MERKWEGKLFGVCLVKRGGRKINGRVRVFSPQVYQLFCFVVVVVVVVVVVFFFFFFN